MAKQGKLKLSRRDAKTLKGQFKFFDTVEINYGAKKKERISRMSRGLSSIISGKSNHILVDNYDLRLIYETTDIASQLDYDEEDNMSKNYEKWINFDVRMTQKMQTLRRKKEV